MFVRSLLLAAIVAVPSIAFAQKSPFEDVWVIEYTFHEDKAPTIKAYWRSGDSPPQPPDSTWTKVVNDALAGVTDRQKANSRMRLSGAYSAIADLVDNGTLKTIAVVRDKTKEAIRISLPSQRLPLWAGFGATLGAELDRRHPDGSNVKAVATSYRAIAAVLQSGLAIDRDFLRWLIEMIIKIILGQLGKTVEEIDTMIESLYGQTGEVSAADAIRNAWSVESTPLTRGS